MSRRRIRPIQVTLKTLSDGVQKLENLLVADFFRIFPKLRKSLSELSGRRVIIEANKPEQMNDFCFRQLVFLKPMEKYLGTDVLDYVGWIPALVLILARSSRINFRSANSHGPSFKRWWPDDTEDRDRGCVPFFCQVDSLPRIRSSKTPVLRPHLEKASICS